MHAIYASPKWLMTGLAVLMFFIGCSSSGGIDQQPVVTAHELPEYRIGSGDQVRVDVWKNPELSALVLVRPDGKISIPLIGDVQASYKTTDELSRDITEKLSNFIRTPQVAVIIDNPSSADFQRRVRVTGAVNNPISIPYREGMTVLDLVLEAGGVSDFAAANKAILLRKNTEGVVQSYSLRLQDILSKGKLETNYPLAPSDVISVPERSF